MQPFKTCIFFGGLITQGVSCVNRVCKETTMLQAQAQVTLPDPANSLVSEWDKNWTAVTTNPFDFSAWYLL